jgi:hypothetical protein
VPTGSGVACAGNVGGPASLKPRTGWTVWGCHGINILTTARTAITTIPTSSSFTSRPRGVLRMGRGRGVHAFGVGRLAWDSWAAVTCAACSRVVPQWHVETRLGTRRLQLGHAHVTDDIGLPS